MVAAKKTAKANRNRNAVPDAVPVPEDAGSSFVITGKPYDVLNQFVRVLLPALGTLYFALSEIWGLPYGKAVVGTVAAVNLFFGSVVHVSSKNYKKTDGDVDAYVPPGTFGVEFAGKDKVTFKVDPALTKK